VKRPLPQKHGECLGCGKFALCMPVPVAPGWPIIVWMQLCLVCRLNERSDQYGTLGWEMEHSPRASTRAAYHEWLEATGL
jgi:hypothetical protein